MIEKLRAIAAKRTNGEWTSDWDKAVLGDKYLVFDVSNSADAEFIAMASNLFDEMLAVIEAARRAQSADHNFQCTIHTSKVACSCGLQALDYALQALHTKIKTELGE